MATNSSTVPRGNLPGPSNETGEGIAIDPLPLNPNMNNPAPTTSNPNENIPRTSADKRPLQSDYHGPGPRIDQEGAPLAHGQLQGLRGMKPNSPTEYQRSQRAWAQGDGDVDTLRQSWGGDPSRHAMSRGPATRGSEKRSASAGNGIRKIKSLHKTRSVVRGHIVATIGEFVGTIAFLFFAFAGTQVANASSVNSGGSSAPDPQILTYVALSFGFSLMVNAWVFYRISGGLFNPAVTLAMLLTGAIDWLRAALLTIAQILGAILASAFVLGFFPESLNVNTTLSNTTSLARGFFIETALTMELVFTILMLAKEKHKATFMAPIGIGLALFIAELVGVYYTGGSLNPARSFGPAVVSGSFGSEHWIYWVGPAFGSLLAVGLYKLILLFDYEVGNPGQDEDSEEKAEEVAELTQARIDEASETV